MPPSSVLEPAVLGNAAIVDAHAGQHLDARRQGRGHRRRPRHHVPQHAVDSAAHEQLARVRLDVNVGRAAERGELENPVQQNGDVRLITFAGRGVGPRPAQHRLHLVAIEQMNPQDGGGIREERHDGHSGDPAQLGERLLIARVGHGHR